MIRRWMIVPVMGYIWILALLYNSGIGQTIDIYGKTKLLVIVLTLYHIFVSQRFRHIPRSLVMVFLAVVLYTLYTDITYGKTMVDYLWIYLLIPLIALLPVEKLQMKFVSIMYGVLGLAVLFIYNFAHSFDGWNTNFLAMIALFSFCVMIVSFNKTTNIWIIAIFSVYVVLYFSWIKLLNSRSGTLFALIMILCVLKIFPIRQFLKSKFFVYFMLIVPLLVAIFLEFIQNMDFVADLNSWSIQQFNKPIFNGRDSLVHKGFDMWGKHLFFGNGDLGTSRWHNSAITLLVGGGVFGFSLCVVGIGKIINSANKFLDDNIVFGLIVGFIIIWIQQSVELGLIASQANAIPYAMLGLLLGRVKTIKIGERDG